MADRLSRPPASLTSESYIQNAVPAQMFETITNGVLPTEAEAGMPPMPPFGPASSNPISEPNRWDLIAAIYSMGTTPSSLEAGEAVYEESCQECHGEEGNAASFDLTDPAYWSTRSNQDLFELLTAGEDAVADHAEYDLEEEALRNVVGYARTFGYDYADPFIAFAPIEVAVITGTVTNETSGGTVTPGTPAELNAFTANFEPALTMTTTVSADGTFAFNLTQVAPDLVYVVTVEHEGISFGSDFGEISRQDPRLTLPVTVYEQTTDPATVSVGQLHVILEFTEDAVSVNELYPYLWEKMVSRKRVPCAWPCRKARRSAVSTARSGPWIRFSQPRIWSRRKRAGRTPSLSGPDRVPSACSLVIACLTRRE
jgi:hypothetical protein